jgi:hypothetical protein
MKKVITFILLVITCITAVTQNTRQTLFSMYNESSNTKVSIFETQDGCFYIETVLTDTNESFRPICIGKTSEEMRSMLETTKYFLEHPELEYILIRIGGDYLKLFREANESDEEPNIVRYPFITDGTESYSEIPIQLITEVLQMLSLK